MLGATVAMVLGMLLLRGGEQPVSARIVTVGKGSIRNVVALEGRVGFQDETAAYALMTGFVESVYVQPGERVAEGQALLRLEGDALDRAASVWASQDELHSAVGREEIAALLDQAVVRAPENAVVRQVLTAEHALVAAGTPVVMLSSAEQSIVCQAAEADASKVQTGMKAELSMNGQPLCGAEVTEVSPLAADPVTGRLYSRITLKPDKGLPKPAGTALEAEVILISRDHVNILPLEAVTERGTVWRVYEGRCTEIPAEIVLTDEISAWVRLPEGMQAAVGEFREGQPVAEVIP